MCSGREVCVLCVEEGEGTLCAVEGKCVYTVFVCLALLCVVALTMICVSNVTR